MLPTARAAMIEGMERWANPSSPHREGRAARAVLEDARGRIKAALGWRHDLIFTSGATEAAQLALTRVRGPRPVLVSAVEHLAVLRQRPDAGLLPVGRAGLVAAETITEAAGALIAVQHVNSETGVIQPIGAIAERVHAAGGTLVVDCAQSAGKMPLPQGDLIAVSAHTLGGPPGIGALLPRVLGLLDGGGGGQESGYRAGTENLPAILAFAAALEAAPVDEALPGWMDEQSRNRAMLDRIVEAHGGYAICGGSPRSPLIASYRMPGVSSAAQLVGFDMAGFAVSAGSACSSGTLRTSHVMAALGLSDVEAGQIIRVSFGRNTTRDEVELFAEEWTRMARQGRRAA